MTPGIVDVVEPQRARDPLHAHLVHLLQRHDVRPAQAVPAEHLDRAVDLAPELDVEADDAERPRLAGFGHRGRHRQAREPSLEPGCRGIDEVQRRGAGSGGDQQRQRRESAERMVGGARESLQAAIRRRDRSRRGPAARDGRPATRRSSPAARPRSRRPRPAGSVTAARFSGDVPADRCPPATRLPWPHSPRPWPRSTVVALAAGIPARSLNFIAPLSVAAPSGSDDRTAPRTSARSSLHQRPVVRRRAGHHLDQPRRRMSAALPVDPPAQPLHQRAELPAGELLAQAAQLRSARA